MRPIVLCLLAVVMWPGLSVAEDAPQPSPDELARMILHGGPAELQLVARWLELADRTELQRVFQAVRVARRLQSEAASVVPARAAQLTVRVIDLRLDRVEALLGDRRPGQGRTAVHLPVAEAEALLAKLSKAEGAEQVAAPSILAMDGQRANVSVLNQVSYIQDFDVAKADGGAVVADPVIGVIAEGLAIELRARQSVDGQSVQLECDSTWSEIDRPIPEVTTRIGGQEVKIQCPEVRVQRAQAGLTMPLGGYALIAGGQFIGAGDNGRERVLLIRVDAVELPVEAGQDDPPGPDRSDSGPGAEIKRR